MAILNLFFYFVHCSCIDPRGRGSRGNYPVHPARPADYRLWEANSIQSWSHTERL